MKTAPFRSWSNEKISKYSGNSERVSPYRVGVGGRKKNLRTTKKSYLKSKQMKSNEGSLKKKRRLKLNMQNRVTSSFLMRKEKKSKVIGKMTKNFLRDEYQYRGKKLPRVKSSQKKSSRKDLRGRKSM